MRGFTINLHREPKKRIGGQDITGTIVKVERYETDYVLILRNVAVSTVRFEDGHKTLFGDPKKRNFEVLFWTDWNSITIWSNKDREGDGPVFDLRK